MTSPPPLSSSPSIAQCSVAVPLLLLSQLLLPFASISAIPTAAAAAAASTLRPTTRSIPMAAAIRRLDDLGGVANHASSFHRLSWSSSLSSSRIISLDDLSVIAADKEAPPAMLSPWPLSEKEKVGANDEQTDGNFDADNDDDNCNEDRLVPIYGRSLFGRERGRGREIGTLKHIAEMAILAIVMTVGQCGWIAASRAAVSLLGSVSAVAATAA